MITADAPTVTYAQCTETEHHGFTTEASDLGLPPGRWPKSMLTDMGNTQPLYLTGFGRDDEGEIVYANYRQEFGIITLRVYND